MSSLNTLEPATRVLSAAAEAFDLDEPWRFATTIKQAEEIYNLFSTTES